MPNRLTLDQLERLIVTYFGPRVHIQSYSESVGRIDFVLYDAFTLSAKIEQPTGVLGLLLLLPGGGVTDRPLGREFSLNNDEQSILELLRAADEYCRLRLPDKDLEAFDARMGTSGSAAG